jgi:nicotinate-nucleotide adenylyltransferase
VRHLRAIVELRDFLELDEVRVVPCGIPPHRAVPSAPAAARVELLEAALADVPGCVVDTRELERGGPSYTVDTLTAMRAQWPDTRLCLLLGHDAFCGLPGWRRWRELFDLAHVAVARRPGSVVEVGEELAAETAARRCDDFASLRTRANGLVAHCDTSQLEISSSHLRRLAAARRTLRWLVPDAVERLIAGNRWYVEVETE